MISDLIEDFGGYIAAFFMGALIIGGGIYKYQTSRYETYVAKVTAAAAVAEAQNKAKELDFAKRNDEIKASYDARIAGLNARISRLRVAAGSGAVSEDTATDAGFNGSAAHLIANPVVLAEACSMTTAQLVELQEYVKHMLAVYNR